MAGNVKARTALRANVRIHCQLVHKDMPGDSNMLQDPALVQVHG